MPVTPRPTPGPTPRSLVIVTQRDAERYRGQYGNDGDGFLPGDDGDFGGGAGSLANQPPGEKTLPRYISGLLDWFVPLSDFIPDHVQYIAGYPDSTVRPDEYITRAEASVVIYRLLSEIRKGEPRTPRFTDANPNAWYAQPVAYLSHIGIVQGYKDGTFKPNTPITRAEYTALVARFDAIEDVGRSLFTDVGPRHWAVRYISGAAAKGFVAGYPDGTFRPDELMTRAEFVTAVNNMLYRGIELADIPEWAPRFADLSERHWGFAGIVEASIGHEYERKENGYELWVGALE